MAAGTSPALNAEWNLAHSVGAVFLVAVVRSAQSYVVILFQFSGVMTCSSLAFWSFVMSWICCLIPSVVHAFLSFSRIGFGICTAVLVLTKPTFCLVAFW